MSVSPPLLRRALRAANYRRPSMAVIAARSIALTLGASLVLLGVLSVLAGAARGQSCAPRERPAGPSQRKFAVQRQRHASDLCVCVIVFGLRPTS